MGDVEDALRILSQPKADIETELEVEVDWKR